MEYFVALAEEKQFTRAADLTMVSQSGLSASIRNLEDELGARLFTRTTRRVELTAAGEALLPHAQALLAQANAGRDAVTSTVGELAGHLRVGSEQCLGLVDVSELLDRFHRRYGRVDIAFEQDGSARLLSRLRAGELDVAFVAGSAKSSGTSSLRLAGLDHVSLGEEPVVLLARSDHPLADKRRVSWEDLEGATFIDFGDSWAARILNDETFATRGLQRQVAFAVNDVHTLLDLVQRGLGIALVPRPIASKPQANGLVRLPLEQNTDASWRVTAVVGASERSALTAAKLLELLPPRREQVA
ncbi:MAG: Hca operon transcriptional activator [Glaciihabitans sp.]|jgi:DNA-binding transcriptional LysR family regulator|nr:Hca operon transcriptional activator [Glaciihabitans sp.]MCU1535353.1 Hca operon transcriptional activator [Glaciihabitans sp.]